MSKVLTLVFATEGNRTLQFSLDNPVENLTLTSVKASCDKIIPVLMATDGSRVTALKSAEYITTSTEEITD